MKKYLLFCLAIAISSMSLAQKKELKQAEKDVKANNFASAKKALQIAEGLKSNMDDKTLAKFYFLKGQAYYGIGNVTDADITEALANFDEVKKVENKSGRKTYTPKVKEIQVTMTNNFVEKAQNALSSKDFLTSYVNFEKAYRVSSADTLYLYNAAVLASQSKKYDESLAMYDELTQLGYTGISMEYLAVNVQTQVEETFPSKQLRDISVRSKSHMNPRDNKTKSRVGDMAKNIALIYIELGDTDKAMDAIEKAKELYPDDINLILSEANIRYKLGQLDEYQKLVAQALEQQPDNVDLIFNLGVVSAETKNFKDAKKYYDMVIDLDPEYMNAYMNMAALILDQEEGIVNEMNGLGSSAADDKRYEELKVERQKLYLDAIPYLKSAMEINPKNVDVARTLMNIYIAIDDTANYEAMKAKVEAIEAGN